MRDISFKKVNENRREFIRNNNHKDHVFFEGENNILISTPHGVSQLRLGKLKKAEISSLNFTLQLLNSTNCSFIFKTKNSNDDANFDSNCSYRKTLKKAIKKGKIKYLIDFHGLASTRECDVNLGVNLGQNISNDIRAYETLKNKLEKAGFSVSVDNPFMAPTRTIAGSMKAEFDDLWTIQVEINCLITNEIKNYEKFKKLKNVFLDWFETISK